MDENKVKLKPKIGFEKVRRVAVPGKVFTFPPYEIEESEYPNVKKYFDIDGPVEAHPKLEAPTPKKEEKEKEKAVSTATKESKKEKDK